MTSYWLNRLLRKKFLPMTRVVRNRSAPRSFSPEIESLTERIMPAVSAVFTPAVGLLTITGDAQDNTIVVSRDAAGRILVNGGAVAMRGGTPTVAKTNTISVFGLDGNDTIRLDESNGALPKAQLFGGAGNDLLTGGSATDLLFGEAGNDTLLGKGGSDLLFGGAGDDVLTGGTGNDQVFGEAGNDRMIWSLGEGTDLNEGGVGIDTVEVNGGNGAESFTVTPNGTRVRFDRTSPAPFSLDIGTAENLQLNMNGGDDTFTASNGLAGSISLSVDGGAGNDQIIGGDGNDHLVGGDGNDSVTGGRGNDMVYLGAGDDAFVWNPGDGSDTVEGQAGNDTMTFNGSNVNEKFNLSANGNRLQLLRDVGAVTMDTNEIEIVNLNALGGADAITLNDLSATGVKQVNIDLGATPGVVGGDSQSDIVTVTGTDAMDNVEVYASGSGYAVAGLSTFVAVASAEGATDNLQVNLLGGNDSFDASGLTVGIVNQLTVDGGANEDVIIGSPGADRLLGGDGNDLVVGGRGNDLALMGDGSDTFAWNPGDGSDLVEGQAGFDTMVFNGSDANEYFDLSSNDGRLRLFLDVGAVTMDVNDVEQVNLAAMGGADTVTVNDLAGTDVAAFNLNLNSANGNGDGQPDIVTINGSGGNDVMQIASSNTENAVRVGGLSFSVKIAGPEGMNDKLIAKGGIGDDSIDASSLTADVIELTLDGGAGNDTLIGSQGDDLFLGGRDSDSMYGRAGNDTFVWNPGDGSDIVEGQDGADTMQFNGSNVGEKIVLTNDEGRVRLSRDVGNVNQDMNGIEKVNLAALGGADSILIDDMTGTAVTEVNIDLGSPANSGAGDGQADSVTVLGANGDDAITAAGDANGVSVLGLPALVNIKGAEAANDRLVFYAQAGDDALDASGLTADSIQLKADGGDGDDVLIGGDGNDTLCGGAGDDVLIGGPGQDVLNGGSGDNILIQ